MLWLSTKISRALWASITDHWLFQSVSPWVTQAVYYLSIVCQKLRVPWKALLTSGAMWANIIAFFCFGWTILTLDFALPRFMMDIMGYNIEEVYIKWVQ